MPSEPAAQFPLDASIVAQLACPVCHGELRLEATRLVCTGCRHAYPVIDGIPVLIAERAEAAGLGRRGAGPAAKKRRTEARQGF